MEERDVLPGSILFVRFSLSYGNTQPRPEALSTACLLCEGGKTFDTNSSANSFSEHVS